MKGMQLHTVNMCTWNAYPRLRNACSAAAPDGSPRVMGGSLWGQREGGGRQPVTRTKLRTRAATSEEKRESVAKTPLG